MISKFTGPILGILSFSVATFSGLMAGLPITTILTRAIGAMIIFCMLGSLIGWVAQLAINDHFRGRKQELEAADSALDSTDANPPLELAAKVNG